jgi:hypothetical protein
MMKINMKFNELTREQQEVFLKKMLLHKEILNHFIQNRFDEISIYGSRKKTQYRIKSLMNKEYDLIDIYLFLGIDLLDCDGNEMCFDIIFPQDMHKNKVITIYIKETKWIEQSREYKLEKLLSSS